MSRGLLAGIYNIKITLQRKEKVLGKGLQLVILQKMALKYYSRQILYCTSNTVLQISSSSVIMIYLVNSHS